MESSPNTPAPVDEYGTAKVFFDQAVLCRNSGDYENARLNFEYSINELIKYLNYNPCMDILGGVSLNLQWNQATREKGLTYLYQAIRANNTYYIDDGAEIVSEAFNKTQSLIQSKEFVNLSPIVKQKVWFEQGMNLHYLGRLEAERSFMPGISKSVVLGPVVFRRPGHTSLAMQHFERANDLLVMSNDSFGVCLNAVYGLHYSMHGAITSPDLDKWSERIDHELDHLEYINPAQYASAMTLIERHAEACKYNISLNQSFRLNP